MLRGHLPTTTDTDQLTRLRTAGRPTGLIFTNDRCSLLYMNGCELSTFDCRIHHAFDEESMAAPSTYSLGSAPRCQNRFLGALREYAIHTTPSRSQHPHRGQSPHETTPDSLGSAPRCYDRFLGALREYALLAQ